MSRRKSKKKTTVGRSKWVSTAVLRTVKEDFDEWNDGQREKKSFTSFLSEAGRMRLDQLKGSVSSVTVKTDTGGIRVE